MGYAEVLSQLTAEPQRGQTWLSTTRDLRVELDISDSTSEERYLRWPLGKVIGVRRPVFAQRVTVFGSTLNNIATSLGRNIRSVSWLILTSLMCAGCHK